MMRSILEFEDSNYYGKKVLMRVDFNVSMDDGVIGEDYRIRMAIPTIEYLTKRGAKLILMSHLGRPMSSEKKYSLGPVAKWLSEILPVNKVKFANDCVGSAVEKEIAAMEKGDVLLLENLRFHKEEELNDQEFSNHLASMGDFYVNDAFSTSHRRHASTCGAALLFNKRAAGLNLKREVEYLSMIRDDPIKPLILVVGGVKIQDKIGALENLLPKADKLLLGGATAYTFLLAKGSKTGNSLIDNEHLAWATEALSSYGEKIMLPMDHIVSSSVNESSSAEVVEGNIPNGLAGFDIGIQTAQRYSSEIGGSTSGTIFWNGPMGSFEVPMFANGTINIAKSMALAFWRGSKTLVGGGDTIQAMKTAGVSEGEVTHVSTGGGATLRFLAGDLMPGLQALDLK
jgi:phosphoglycerate kinase